MRINRDSSLAQRAFELYDAIDEGVNGVVSTDANIWTWVELSSSLAHDDSTWLDDFSAVLLNSKSLRVGIATVSRRTLTFFMCH